MKLMLLTMMIALTMTSCRPVDAPGPVPPEPVEPVTPGKPYTPPAKVTVDWYAAADSASMELLNRYWPPLLTRVAPTEDVIDKWHFTATQDNKSDPNNNYWHQPHALDPIIDAYNRTPSTDPKKQLWLGIFDKWFQGVPRFQYQSNENWAANRWTSRFPWAATDGAGGWRNHFIDDMEWQVLTMIRMYEALREDEPALAAKYFDKGKEIYDKFVWTLAWDDPERGGDGGVFWMRDTAGTNSKNACSNGPAMAIAAKLAYYSTGDERAKYQQQAVLIYEWMMAHLWNNTGAISDHWTGGGEKRGGALTYNQGTFIGGCHWLYKVTGNALYLRRAITAVQYSINNLQRELSNGTPILNSESGPNEGNNTVFRAIFLRYFVDMINEPEVDVETPGQRKIWYTNLKNWANYVWRDGNGIDKGDGTTPGAMLFGYDWRTKLLPSEIAAGVNLGNMVSGVVLVEAMNIAKDPSKQ